MTRAQKHRHLVAVVNGRHGCDGLASIESDRMLTRVERATRSLPRPDRAPLYRWSDEPPETGRGRMKPMPTPTTRTAPRPTPQSKRDAAPYPERQKRNREKFAHLMPRV